STGSISRVPQYREEGGPMQASTPAVSLPPDMQHLLLERVLRSTSDVKFKLKCFSGTSPRPSGEVDYFTWRAQAKEMMEDSEIADKVKRRKIIESLLPPALKVVLGAGSKASAGECFDILEKGYGNVINASELKAQFSETYQHTRELPSVYLTRLQALAQEVLEAGGVKDAELDSYIQDQFFRGCWHESLLNTLLIRGINCSDRKRSVSYATLLFEVRSIEREHSDKQKRKLRQELEEKGRPLSRSSVQLIKTSENISSAPEKATTIDWKEKYLQVEQQLAGFSQTNVASQWAQETDVTQIGVSEVVRQLVGPACYGYVYLDGVKSTCLIDTGSQVTCICETFYYENLSHRKLQSIDNILQIEGAGGQM
uniref:Paraneoplastic antigen Ma-like C-terminal domain-containing protein n=1 Tax=Pelusios castaneus TaxID=367368 RepID=A0A8C8RTU7_9SAUR